MALGSYDRLGGQRERLWRGQRGGDRAIAYPGCWFVSSVCDEVTDDGLSGEEDKARAGVAAVFAVGGGQLAARWCAKVEGRDEDDGVRGGIRR